MPERNANVVFDYRALRLLMGFIALSLPLVVSFLAKESLASVSASYYTDARDAFVGLMFVVSAFLWAYNGHTPKEGLASKGASLAAILVAIFPTACKACGSSLTSIIHVVAAVALFSILAYFCFGPFRQRTKGQHGKKGRRSKIYLTCGCVMVGAMAAGLVAELTLPAETIDANGIMYWVEAIALGAFGVAWIVSGKYFRILVDEEEALHIFRR